MPQINIINRNIRKGGPDTAIWIAASALYDANTINEVIL